MLVNGCRQKSGYQHSLKYNLLCSTEERNSYRFGTAWGWGSTDNLILGLTIPLKNNENVLQVLATLPMLSVVQAFKWVLGTFQLLSLWDFNQVRLV